MTTTAKYSLRSKRQRVRLPNKQSNQKANPAFWVLTLLLVIVFFTGGSARGEVPALVVLRPLSILIAAYAVVTTKFDQWKAYWASITLIGLIVLLIASHIMPLPPSIWQALPGREPIIENMAFLGASDIWLPLAMAPSQAWNALYAIFTPVAVFFLATQLSDNDNVLTLSILAALCLVSALFGVMQAAGVDIKLYGISSDIAGLFANRNHQATLLAISIPLLASIASLGIRYGLKNRLLQVLAVVVCVALVPLILVTGSRMGLVVCAISAVGVLFVNPAMVQAITTKQKWMLRSVLAGSTIAVVALLVFVADQTSRNLAVARIGSVDDDIRYSVWRQVYSILPEYLPWGSGVGSYVEIYQLHEPVSLLTPEYSNHAHNDFLEVVVTTGFPGAAILLLAIGFYVVSVSRSMKASASHAHFNRLGLLIIAVLAIASSVDYPLRTPLLAAVFALAAAWASRPPSEIHRRKGKEVNG